MFQCSDIFNRYGDLRKLPLNYRKIRTIVYQAKMEHRIAINTINNNSNIRDDLHGLQKSFVSLL